MRRYHGAAWIAIGLGLVLLARAGHVINYQLMWGGGGPSFSSVKSQVEAIGVAALTASVLGAAVVLTGLASLLAAARRGRGLLVAALVAAALTMLNALLGVLFQFIPAPRSEPWRWMVSAVSLISLLGWAAFLAAGVQLARDARRPLPLLAVAVAALVVVATLGLQVASLAGQFASRDWYLWGIVVSPLALPPAFIWVALLVARLPSEGAEESAQPEGAGNKALGTAIGSYRGAVVARLWLFLAVAFFFVVAMVGRSRGLATGIAVLGGIGDLIIGFLLVAAALAIASASDGPPRFYAQVAAFATGAGLLLGGWALMLTFSTLGVDESSSMSRLRDAVSAEEKLPTITNIAQILGLCATLPLIGAIHEGLMRAGVHRIARRSAGVALALVIGGLGAVVLRGLITHRMSAGLLLIMLGLALGVLIAILVIFLGYLGAARDELLRDRSEVFE